MKRKVVPLSAAEQYGLLRRVDILAAIDYFGVDELLDHIGVGEIARYSKNSACNLPVGQQNGADDVVKAKLTRRRDRLTLDKDKAI